MLTSSTVAQDDEVLVLLSGSHWGWLLCCCAKQFPFCSQCLSHKGGGWKCSVCRAVGSSVRQQQKSREQSYGSVLLLSLRPHLRLHICLIKRKQEVKIKMLHSSNYRFDRGQNQPAKGVSNIRTGEQNLSKTPVRPTERLWKIWKSA